MLGVNKEHIYSGDVMKVETPLDWESIDEKLRKLREESVEFLARALG